MKAIVLTDFQARLLDVLKFFVVFNLFAIPLFIVGSLDLYLFEVIETNQVAGILSLGGFNILIFNVFSFEANSPVPALRAGEYSFTIDKSCTGYKSMIAFLGLCFATPGIALRRKLKSFILLPLVYLFNIGRLTLLYVTAVNSPAYFDLSHLIFWREGLVLFIIVIWFFWARNTRLLNLRIHTS